MTVIQRLQVDYEVGIFSIGDTKLDGGPSKK